MVYIGLFCILYAFSALLFFSFFKRSMMMYSGEICLADYINLLGGGSFVNLLLIPLSMVFIITSSEKNHTTLNYYIRNKKRASIFLKQLFRIITLSIVLSILIVILSIFVAGLLTAKIINWNQYNSLFYMSNGVLLNIGITDVVFITVLKLFFPIVFFSVFSYMINLVTKKIYAFILVIFFSASNCIGYLKYRLSDLFASPNSEISYLSLSSKILMFIIFPLLTLVIVVISYKLIKRKDYLVT